MKIIYYVFVLLLLGALANELHAQTNNTYNKTDVMNQIKSLNSYTQGWISDNFEILNDNQISVFIANSTREAIKKKYAPRIIQLKAKMNAQEFESLLKSITEQSLLDMLSKYGI